MAFALAQFPGRDHVPAPWGLLDAGTCTGSAPDGALCSHARSRSLLRVRKHCEADVGLGSPCVCGHTCTATASQCRCRPVAPHRTTSAWLRVCVCVCVSQSISWHCTRKIGSTREHQNLTTFDTLEPTPDKICYYTSLHSIYIEYQKLTLRHNNPQNASPPRVPCECYSSKYTYAKASARSCCAQPVPPPLPPVVPVDFVGGSGDVGRPCTALEPLPPLSLAFQLEGASVQ